MLNWQNLAPHKPLDENDPLYVERPGHDGGERLAKLVAAGVQAVVVTGPVGVGKSTELAQAAHQLRTVHGHHATLVHLDRLLDMRNVTEEQVFTQISQMMDRWRWERTGRRWIDATLTIDQPVVGDAAVARSKDRFLATLRRVQKLLGAQALGVAILIDGLEKAPEDAARRIVQALFEMRDELKVVVVVPHSLVVGPRSYEIVQSYGAKLHVVRAVYVESSFRNADEALLALRGTESGQLFFYRLAERRLGSLTDASAEFLLTLLQVSSLSGGVPRVFLQLLREAEVYARLGGRELPNHADVEDACEGQRDTLRLMLRNGDLDAIAAAQGTSGTEIPEDRRLRFLTHGLMLEYRQGDRVFLRMAPLLGELISTRLKEMNR